MERDSGCDLAGAQDSATVDAEGAQVQCRENHGYYLKIWIDSLYPHIYMPPITLLPGNSD